MNLGLFFDTESTGIPIWNRPSGTKAQPHIVQMAAILADLNTGQVFHTVSAIVKPEGWTIPKETIEVHGITNKLANEVGISEAAVLAMFINLWLKCELRIAHNTTFDNRILRIALKRYMPDLIPDEKWKNRDDYYCTFQNFKKMKGGKSGHTLGEAYKHFTGNELEGAHDALVDTQACMEIFFGLQKEIKQTL